MPNECCHHWLIDKDSGPVSLGTCKLCGEVRQFSNMPPWKNPFGNTKSNDNSHKKGHTSRKQGASAVLGAKNGIPAGGGTPGRKSAVKKNKILSGR